LKKISLGKITFSLLSGIVLASCAQYKQNIMFKVPDGYAVKQQAIAVEKNYIIQSNDYLELEVFTNKGERIIDPDFALSKELGTQNRGSTRIDRTYLVDIKGTSKFPMLGEIKVDGLTIRQAEEMLQKAYSEFYKDAFVILKYVNKRVIILGAQGGQVIPLVNENLHLVEVLALAKGLDNNAKAQNIRVIRGDDVFVADLSTIEGYLKNNIAIEPGDIIYVEPIRKPVVEATRDYAIVISMITSLTTLILVLFSL
jgi:polysaccharide biosynthesis/export protein